ncbi:MAG TPA: condensation domain-containing protein [Thermoanaerobaculia bacterium]|nr:condensation domain-containing protein [Thermoanaerobaculia bacterium]
MSYEHHPLSYGQRALWFLQKLAPGSAAYNVPFSARVRAPLDAGAVRRAFQALADRHPALRTTYPMVGGAGGAPVQEVHERLEIDFGEIDAAAWGEEELRRGVAAEVHRPFDLERGPVLRLRLFRQGPEDHVLLLVMHHIAVDFLSLVILLEDLRTLLPAALAGEKPVLPLPERRYTDFVHWQVGMLQGPEGERQWEHWRGALSGELPRLELPTDRPRPRIQSFRGGVQPFSLEERTAAPLAALAREEGTTLFTVLLAALKVLLHRVTGQVDLVVGSTLPGRPGPDYDGVVGYFVNTVLLRGDLSGDPPFRQFLAREARVVSAALEHQHLPFPVLVERLAPERDLGVSPLYQVLFAFYQGEEERVLRMVTGDRDGRFQLGSLELEPFPVERRTAMMDLTLNAVSAAGTVRFALEYDADLFDASTVEGLAEHFQRLLLGIVEDPYRRLSDLDTAALLRQSLALGGEKGAAGEERADTRRALLEQQKMRRRQGR